MALNQLKYDQLETGSVYPITASYAISSSVGSGGTSLITGSTYPITSSWSNNSISSSYSLNSSTASYLDPISQSLIPSTGSTYSLGSPTNKWKDLYVSTGSIYIGETVLSTSGSTLFANTSPVVTLNTASGQIEIIGITASLSASYATNVGLLNNTSSTIFATTGSNNFNGNQTVQGNITIVGSLIAQQYIVSSSVSYFTSSNFDGSTKFGDTDSDTHQFTGSLRSPNITGSLLGTSSFSNNSISASYSLTSSVALTALTSSYINIATNAVSSSYAGTASVSTSSSFATTSSYNINSISSSYSLTASFVANAGSSLITGSTYPITSSWSNNSISSSYSTFAVSATSATSATSANTATSASYATNAGSSTSATTANTANSATSASYSLSSSYSVNSNTAISSSFASTASYNLNSISSSFSTNASTASYVVNSISSSYAFTASHALNAGGGGTTLTTGSTYPITSSWSNNATTASYALNSSGESIPVVSVASLNNQTILYNFSSSQEVTITGLTLTNNNWGINVVEEWNSGSGDIYYPSCSLLMHFSGSNNSTTFIDNSLNNLTVTSNNGAKITSSVSKFGDTSGFFDGTNDYLSIANNTVFAFGTGNFTVEAWIYRTGGSGNQPICQSDAIGGSTNDKWWFAVTSTGLFFGTHDAGGFSVTTTTTFNTNTWYHVAVTRNSGTMYLFINGVSTSFTTSGTPSGYSLSQNGLSIGGMSTPSYWTGYIDELRITKGIARYTGSFTTQSVEFPNQLPQYETKYIGLIGGLNDTGSDYGVQKLDDTSLKIRKMSVSGTPISGSPFLSSSVDRVYVNVLNYTNVSVGSPLLGQTFTAVGSTSSYALSRSVINPYEIVVAVDGAVQSFNNAYSVTSSTINFTESIPSGSLVDIRFLTTPNVNSASYALTSSYALNGGSGGGSVSTGSIVNQTILYNFSSSQESTITGINLTGNKWGINVIEEWDSGSGDIYYPSCSLLCHFDSVNSFGNFIDNSRNNLSITSSGNTKLSVSQYKFGGASAYFDGTGDYLILNTSVGNLGTVDWTIECWWKSEGTSGNQSILIGKFPSATNNAWGLKNRFTSDILSFAYYNSGFVDVNTSVNPNDGLWHHIAASRTGTTLRLFMDGTLATTHTLPASFNFGSGITTGSTIAYNPNDNSYASGYIDDMRVTVGFCRYTASFSVPTSAFPNSATQIATKYIGLVGGLNDSNVDYGIEKLSDTSLKIKKLTDTQQPSGSFLSSSVDRVYVNVLNYENAVITGSISNAVTASFAQTTPSGKSIALSFILG